MTQQESTKNAVTKLPRQRLDSVHCLMIPLADMKLLLPNAAVAEVISYSKPDPIDAAPSWLLGRLTWRDRAVPLISFEAAAGKDVIQDGKRIAVLNTLNSNSRVPYIAVVMQDIPKLKLVQEDLVKSSDAGGMQQSVAASVLVENETVIVPDIDDLEQRLDKLSQTAPN